MSRSLPTSAREAQEGAALAVEALLRDYDAFLFDCDGTLYHAGTLIPHVGEAIAHLRSLGKKVFFVTNTSSRSSSQLQSKLTTMGVPCEEAECVPSGVFTANYVKRTHPDARRVYVIGGQGLCDELHKVGIDTDGGPVEDATAFTETQFEALATSVASEHFDGVVVGFDTGLNYHKIAKSSLVFQKHPGAFFYATNDDLNDRLGGALLPASGCLLPALEAACGCAHERKGKAAPYGVKATSLGKPNPDFARLIAEWNGLDLSKAVMVGDRLDTDIEMGNRAGMGSCFVLTGVHDLSEISKRGVEPTSILPSVGSLWTDRPRPRM
eukprot:TRINITY_DN51673_c0_g2_i1.p1 TRINITY_DN51673_c0_g2~~TRINITY_DN51673_c0_g2_i1.p1  ORF type:complete len:324 (+),score=50.62 TRINITY_DN51673_c0_g2_i1:69-1040(+)